MTATTPSTHDKGQDQDRQGASFKSVVLLSIPHIIATLAISTGAGFESFFAFRGLALLFGWNPDHAWMVWPLVELFLLVGALEDTLRQMDGASKRQTRAPRFVSYGALVVTLAANVGYRVLTLILPVADGKLVPGATLDFRWWQVIMIGLFASIIPISQLGALHFLAGRLKRLAEYRARDRDQSADSTQSGRGIGTLLRQAAEARLAAIVTPPTTEPGATIGGPADRRTENADDRAADRRSDGDTDRDGDGSDRRSADRTDRRSERENDRDGDADRRSDRSIDRDAGRGDRRSADRSDRRPPDSNPRSADRRSGSAGGDRSPDRSSDREETSGDQSPQLREQSYREYADAIDAGNGFEPTAGTIAAKIGLSESRARNVRAEWRRRYAAEHLSGDRTPAGSLPPAIARVLDNARVEVPDPASDKPADAANDRPTVTPLPDRTAADAPPDRPQGEPVAGRAETPVAQPTAVETEQVAVDEQPVPFPRPRPRPLQVVPTTSSGDGEDREPAAASA
ncbi:hypothetical protein [Micromonospora haikouensis]|uniref:hypothetical protein n=1 Tax=Micromonospora haikouensis TaxID=686309 RepID=UPI003D75FE76